MTLDTTIATLDRTMTLDERDEALIQAIADDDDEAFSELMGTNPSGELADPPRAPIEQEKPKKPTKAEQEAAAKEEARLALQARVPFEIAKDNGYYGDQKRKIDQWADDWGAFPRQYRSYTTDEWAQAIDLLAETVLALGVTHPEYQRTTGLYVEEYERDLLLIRSKEWQLLIQVPSKSSAKGKTFKLEAAAGKDAWGGTEKRADAFAELLTQYVPTESRDVLLDICCQYLRDVRIRVNRAVWGQENPDLAYLLDQGR